MANENDIVFSMNAGQLICKLHLAGQEQLFKAKCISINTGYINPDIKATPVNPGNVDFNLDNKGLYELGIFRTLEYYPQLDVTKNKDLVKALNEYQKFLEKNKINVEEDKPDNKKEKEQSLTVKPGEDKKTDSNNSLQKDYPKEIENLTIQLNRYTGILKEYLTKKDKAFEDITKEKYKEISKDNAIDEQKKNEFFASIKAAIDDFNTAVKKHNEDKLKLRKEAEDLLKKDVYNLFKTYFTTVAGKEAGSKIQPTDIFKLDGSVDAPIEKDITEFKGTIKNFAIDTSNIKKEVQKKEEEFYNKPETVKEPIKRSLLYVVKYAIEQETI